jgi:hypothetical protein
MKAERERKKKKKKVRIKILLETYAVAFFVEGPIMYVLVLLVEIVRKIHFQNFFLSVCQKTDETKACTRKASLFSFVSQHRCLHRSQHT